MIDGRVQPLLVTLRTEECASELLQCAPLLRKSRDEEVRKQVFINKDLTPAESLAAFNERARRRNQRVVAVGNLQPGSGSDLEPSSASQMVDLQQQTMQSRQQQQHGQIFHSATQVGRSHPMGTNDDSETLGGAAAATCANQLLTTANLRLPCSPRLTSSVLATGTASSELMLSSGRYSFPPPASTASLSTPQSLLQLAPQGSMPPTTVVSCPVLTVSGSGYGQSMSCNYPSDSSASSFQPMHSFMAIPASGPIQGTVLCGYPLQSGTPTVIFSQSG